MYRFSINQSLADQIRAAQQLDLHGEGAGARISVDFHDTGLRDALQTVFKASAFQYVLGQNVPNVPVTLQLKDLTVPQTLRLLVKQAAAHVPGLTLSRDGGVWLIRIPAVISEPRDEPPAPESESFGVELQWEKIPLHYLSVRTIIRLSGGGLVEDLPVKAAQHGQSGAIPSPLGNQKLPAGAEASVVAAIPPGITNLLGVVADNTLIVRGTPDDVNALKDLLHLLDLPRRQLRIRFTMGSLSAEGIAFNLASATISHGDAATALNLTAAPHLLGDGNIDLTVSGSIRTSGRSRPVRVQARIVPGKTTRLLMVATGKHASELRVRVDALSDPPPSELPRQ